MQIVREAAEGVSTSELAERFEVTSRAVRYVLKADAERRWMPRSVSAVSVKVTAAELEALDAVLAKAGIGVGRGAAAAHSGGGRGVRSGRADGQRWRDTDLLCMSWQRVTQIATDDACQPDGAGGRGGREYRAEPRLAQMRGLARFILIGRRDRSASAASARRCSSDHGRAREFAHH